MGRFYSRFGKRAFDLAVAVPFSLFFLPVGLLIFVLIKITSPGPGFFYQQRVGKGAKPFTLLKFRTMTHKNHDASVQLFGGEAEITWLGRWLRRLKLDEMPQLVNVLRGDMTLVGPRPMLPATVDETNANCRRRLSVLPGMTGQAQIHGNIYLTWPERWEYDADYVNSCSLWLDLKIIVGTFAVVFLGEKRFTKPMPSAKGSPHE
ncbi:Sugar transferase [Sulfidibacter corallicola]|uniref:Sugar transferase n=1 Tax=Sulfidibacter corallicola TaxID=2818388 RepID=A0A8A4TZ22_SULCO|nr:sugar transferase [Sulfidibacter corallicola]QTD54344.1 sugar transferase [Sulfidibacter corallicola]